MIEVQVQAESYLGTSVSDANMTVTWNTALASGLLVRGWMTLPHPVVSSAIASTA